MLNGQYVKAYELADIANQQIMFTIYYTIIYIKKIVGAVFPNLSNTAVSCVGTSHSLK